MVAQQLGCAGGPAPKIPIRFEIVTVEDELIPRLILDANREDWKGHNTSQRALTARRIANRKRGGDQSAEMPNGISIADAAKAIGVSPRMVGMVGQVEATIPALIDPIASGLIKVGLALRIAQIQNTATRAKAIDDVLTGNVRDAIAKIKAYQHLNDKHRNAGKTAAPVVDLKSWRAVLDQLSSLTEDDALTAEEASEIADALQQLIPVFEDYAGDAADREPDGGAVRRLSNTEVVA